MGFDNDYNTYNNVNKNYTLNATDGSDYYYQGYAHDNSSSDDWSSHDLDHNGTYHDYGTPVVVTLSFFLVLSMILALFGNVMVIMTIVRHRGMRTRTNMLLGNLAVADILVAVFDMPIALTTIIYHDWMFSQTFCVVNGFAVGLGLMLSVHTLMWISIHKFLSITRPFARNVTQSQIVVMMLVIWTWTILYNLTSTPLIVYKKGSSQCGPVIPKLLMQRIHSGLNTIFNLVVPMSVMVYCYYKIFKEVKTHLARMRDFADVGVRNSLIQQKQITETLCIVLLLFFIFWAPYIVYSMSLVFCGEKCVPLIFNPISYLCGYMNSACNPVIYALRSQSFRRSFKEIIFGTHSHIPGSSIRSHRGILESFRRSHVRRSERGQRLRRNENGAQRRSRSAARYTPPLTPLPIPKVSVSTCDTPAPSEANGGVQQAEAGGAVEARESGGHQVTITEKVQFQIGSQNDLDRPPCPSPTKHTNYDCPPWQPLQLQVTDAHLSRSCQQIFICTNTMTTRSSSAGAILDVSCRHDTMTTTCSSHTEHTVEPPKRRHFSEVHRPLMWQASIDHLNPSASAMERRRRCVAEGRREGQHPQQTHLGVRRLLSHLRRSFSDLFSIDDDVSQHSET
ncbi:histamine H2 receptor-like isoform X2 [Eriocheir sinensis]|uniref:histamine H2 receptor-like isoform X2 n=1 Tax=Eriocheir sinensis TaxID=95602 RepID=UPI0021C91D19|nr:histamine H2 receptor-like isoform X2 [Eriocheir sinensis]